MRATALEHAAVAVLMLWWAWPMTQATGGRGPRVLTIGLLLAVVAAAACQVWRRVSAGELAAAAVLSVAAIGVCVVSPTGWRGANEAGSWAFTCLTFVCVRAYARTALRTRTVLLLVALAGAVEFASAWLPWWGGEDPSQPMVGTLYWHNQFGAFLLAPAVLALASVVWPRGETRLAGWAAAPLCSVGVLFSTSRATILLLILGWAAVAALALWHPGRRTSLVRLLAVAVVTTATAFLLTGPPFFPHRAAPSAAVSARSQQESMSGNAGYRTQVWREAVIVYREHPVAGVGFHGFGSASTAATPGAPHSAFAHNAWLQALAEGGTLLGLPFLVISLVVASKAIRRGIRETLGRRQPEVVVSALALLLLAGHSLVDFDTSYPALFALLAVLAAIALPSQSLPAGGDGQLAQRRSVVPVAALFISVALTFVPSWHGGLQLNVNVPRAASVLGAGR